MPLRGRPAARGTRTANSACRHTLRYDGFTEDAMPEAAEAILPALLSTLLTFDTLQEHLRSGACERTSYPWK